MCGIFCFICVNHQRFGIERAWLADASRLFAPSLELLDCAVPVAKNMDSGNASRHGGDQSYCTNGLVDKNVRGTWVKLFCHASIRQKQFKNSSYWIMMRAPI